MGFRWRLNIERMARPRLLLPQQVSDHLGFQVGA
jgi:hypothetical protein